MVNVYRTAKYEISLRVATNTTQRIHPCSYFLRLLQIIYDARYNHLCRSQASRKSTERTKKTKATKRITKNRWWNCVKQTVNAKLQIGKTGQKTELIGRSPLRRRRSVLERSAIEEEEEEEEEEEKGGGGGEEVQYIAVSCFVRRTLFYIVLGF